MEEKNARAWIPNKIAVPLGLASIPTQTESLASYRGDRQVAFLIRPIVLRMFKASPMATDLVDMKPSFNTSVLMLERPYTSDKRLRVGTMIEATTACDQVRHNFYGKVLTDNGKTLVVESNNVDSTLRRHIIKTLLLRRIQATTQNS